MTTSLFITATDTDAGKTLIAQALLHIATQRGLSSIGFKPVSAGCERTAQGLRNIDALLLQQASSCELDYAMVNPIAFADPVAPHLAAQKAGKSIDIQTLNQAYQHLLQRQPDLLLVEGAGGWRLPLGQGMFMSDFVKQQQIGVILVVGVKLGCLNHALLTYQALQQDGVKVVGWIANQIDPQMAYLQENLLALNELLDCPCLGSVPYLANPAEAHLYLNNDAVFG